MKGKVYLIGAGPGAADLITVRAAKILREAEVVIYDYLVGKKLLDLAAPDAELICCDTLGKKRYADGFLIHNQKISQLVIKKVRQGKKVVRLKNGDTGIFSRISQELEPLRKENIEFEIVPGITAASGASSFSGIPLTDRRFASSCVFVTGHEDPTKRQSSLDWKAIAKIGTIVLYMAIENLAKIVKELNIAGKSLDTPVAIIKDVSLISQKILTATLKDIVAKAKKERIKPPAIVIIGETAGLEKKFNWLRKSKKILFTGLSKERFFTQEKYFHLPLIKIEPLGDYWEFDNYLKNIEQFDWIVFSSRYGVEYFFKRLILIGKDLRTLDGINIAAIGNSTKAALLNCGIIADLVPKEESAKGLIKKFSEIDLRGKKIFLPRSDISDKHLTKGLEKLGAKVTGSVAYCNVMPADLPDLDLENFQEIIFSSPSGVRNFVRRYGKPPQKIKVSFIGEVTRAQAKKLNII